VTPIEHSIFAFSLAALVKGRKPARAFNVAAMVASTAPDLDGLSVAAGYDAYVRYHRVFAHSILSAALLGIAAAWAALWLWPSGKCGIGVPEDTAEPRRWFSRLGRVGQKLPWQQLLLAGALGGISHVLVDALYHWPIPLLWPLSSEQFAFPLFPWGDLVILALMLASMFGHARWRSHPRTIACVTLAALAAYGVFRWYRPSGEFR